MLHPSLVFATSRDSSKSEIAVVGDTFPRIALALVFAARVELPLVLLVVLFSQLYLAFSVLLELIDRGKTCVLPLLFQSGLGHHLLVQLLLQLVLIRSCVRHYLFLFLCQVIVKILSGSRCCLDSYHRGGL